MPFLTVITRTIPRRQELLAENQRSLASQSDPDYQQLILMDEQQRGVSWANGMLAKRDWKDIQGEYVMILDDDDVLSGPGVIAYLKGHARGQDLYIVRMDHGPRGVLPVPGAEIQRAGVGCSAVIPRRGIFKRAVKSYSSKYDGDFDYIQSCLDLSESVLRLDYIASRVLQIGALSEV